MTKSCPICGEEHDESLNTCSSACLNIQRMQQMRVERLLEMYWNIMSRAPLQRRPHTESELHRLHRYEAEMLFRVDQRIMPADALPPSVYRTWCKITRQEKPENWEVDCGNACRVQDPYGWVPEDGCPVHDTGLENDWAPEPGPFGELGTQGEQMTLPIWNIRGAFYLMRQCACCGETRRMKTINVVYNESALDEAHAVKVMERKIMDTHESVIGDVIEEQSIWWVDGPYVSLAGVK